MPRMDKYPVDPVDLYLNGNKVDSGWWVLKNKSLICHSQMGDSLGPSDVLMLRNLTTDATVTGNPDKSYSADSPMRVWHLFDRMEILKFVRWHPDTASVIQAAE